MCQYFCVCACWSHRGQQRAAWHRWTAAPEHSYIYLFKKEGPRLCSSLDQARLETASQPLSLSLHRPLRLSPPALFWEKPLCAHYSQAHAFLGRCHGQKKARALSCDPVRGTHPPKAPFQDLQTSLTASSLFHARLLPWKRPANGRRSVSHMVTKRVNKSHS